VFAGGLFVSGQDSYTFFVPDPRIRILDPSVARKIAAGEVIERPQSVVRELLDNAIDASATSIDIHLEGGGNDLVRVVDNGIGMGPDDLDRCYLPHATSKITSDQDLLRVTTLGFRGEALASIAAVSRLTVTSRERDADGPAFRVEVHAGKLEKSGQAGGPPGTSVEAEGLFFNMPARKQFLKRPQSEFGMVKSVVSERALAYPEIAFRLFSNGEPKLVLQPAGLVERINTVYPQRIEPAKLHVLHGAGEGFEFTIVAGEPSASRRDRKMIQTFVNGRRIRDYGLTQAIEYSYREHLHGGLFPVCLILLDCSPETVDFNIHPAKREVRLRHFPRIHRAIVDSLSAYLQPFNRSASGTEYRDESPDLDWYMRHPHRDNIERTTFDLSRSFEVPERTGFVAETGESAGIPAVGESGTPFRYLGQLFGLFLVAEVGDTLYLVDQHAAHEKIIFDRLRSGSTSQDLLVPVEFETEPEESAVLDDHLADLERLGLRLERNGEHGWRVTGVPASVEIETEDLVEMVLDLAGQPSDFERQLYASMSCRAAVMDGDIIARETAVSIIRDSLGMKNARCPHGRPIWAEFSRDTLMHLVGRI